MGWVPLALWSRSMLRIRLITAELTLPQIAPLRYRHIGSAAGLLGVWVFTFITVFAGGIALETVGARIWIWPLVFNVIAVVFVYFMCPDVSIMTPWRLVTLLIRNIAHWQDS